MLPGFFTQSLISATLGRLTFQHKPASLTDSQELMSDIGLQCSDWRYVAARKRQELAAKIPKEWRLSQIVLCEAKNRRRLTGDFIEGLLDERTNSITSLDSLEIVQLVRKGALTSVEVTSAFCKRSAIAQQLVSFPGLLLNYKLMWQRRTITCWKYSSTEPSLEPLSLMHTSLSIMILLGRCTDCQLH